MIGEVGQLLIRSGYRVKVLNTINFSKSMKYNPFRYLHSEKDVLKLVNTLICNTKGEGEKSAEDFWVKSERLFYTALIGYIWQEAPEEEMNFTTLLEMINASEAREDEPEFQSPVDMMFERLEERDPDHFAVRQYKKFLLSAGKTRSSILISAGARMAPFDIREVRELMEDDELELDTIGDEKTVLFLIMSDTDTTFNFILAMVQSQLINLLCDRADDKYGGRLPVHVRMILDEFANIGQIPNFDKLIATIRSREISASIILQSQSQLKAIYKDAAEIISDNCDCTLFLSGRGKNAKEISDVLGKETIDSYNQSENRGAQTSHGLNYQKLGKDVPDWCAEDSTYLAKRRLIDETGMTIWRYHDHMHAAAGDRIYWGVADKLGWNQYLVPGQKAPWLYEIPQTTLVDLAADLKRKLDMTTLQTIGDPEMPVNKVLILVGGGSLGLGVEEMPMQAMEQTHADVMLCGDVTEWTTCAYIRDAMQLGQNKAMIKLGHERSEEAGMEYMATWLPDLIDHCCPVIFIDAKEPFVYL